MKDNLNKLLKDLDIDFSELEESPTVEDVAKQDLICSKCGESLTVKTVFHSYKKVVMKLIDYNHVLNGSVPYLLYENLKLREMNNLYRSIIGLK
jgi:hypothetical protein